MILSLIQTDGGTLKKEATTNGGEYAGACPWCGGNDRFRVWPKADRYWCRGCDKTGDAIQYLRDFRGLSYQEAGLFVGREPGPRKEQARPAAWEPKATSAPSELWQSKAKSFLDGAIDCLWSTQGEPIRAWLHDEKGLNDAMIKRACLGYNPTDIYEPRATWGLDPVIKEDGTERKQWIPAGIVIPLLAGDTVQRLRIRRDNPGDGVRYVIASGSSTAPMVWGEDKGAAVIVESELDGLLLSQETGDLCAVMALGSATSKTNKESHDLLRAMPIILISLDTDEAGAKASWHYWPDTHGTKAQRWPCLKGKDPSEARLNGLDLRTWIIAGIFETEEQFERFAIQTIDGGLSDREAIMAIQGGEL
jgi:DNA primase